MTWLSHRVFVDISTPEEILGELPRLPLYLGVPAIDHYWDGQDDAMARCVTVLRAQLSDITQSWNRHRPDDPR